MKKIIIVRGIPTSGKTTITHELAKILPHYIFIDIWKIKEMFEPLNLKDRMPLKSASKKAVLAIMKEVMASLEINIILQETKRSVLNKKLRRYIKNKYEIYSFFLHDDYETAIKRDIKREKPTMRINKLFSRNQWEKQRKTFDRGEVIIDTSNLSIQQVIDIILKKVGEKPKKHSGAEIIRKSW
ncbi:MAG TPA: AAA family ATPase [Candidatus Nanoarchaeia archaeon]|nr:AAA family ATPase [Candidatus Nanoarchaeia archaeon]